MNQLYFGDNLLVLREHVRDESVDLVYLDPPFNSKRDYNLLFKTPKGHQSDAQITAFEDSWQWGEQAEREYAELLQQANTDVAELMPALRSFLGENDMMAYLVMMANRLLELHRVLKATGSLYLHCDPTASHYLKILLDCIFGRVNFRNELYWHYYNKMHDYRKKLFPKATDSILFYVKNVESAFTFHQIKEARAEPVRQLVRKKIAGRMVNARDEEGKLIYQVKEDKTVDNVWRIPMLQPASPERLGYPTQKPVALLERILNASSNPGDVVLDPFCGCGTAVHAAQKLSRRWIGIDITHLAIALIEKRLKDAFPYLNRVKAAKGAPVAPGVGTAEPDAPDYMRDYEVIGTPQDLGGARDLAARDKYQFQWWACSLVNAQPYQGRKKGADGGIDGLIFFQEDKATAKKIVVSVKGGENVNVAMVRDLAHVVEREKAAIGLFVTLAAPSKPMEVEAVKEGFYIWPANGAQFPKLQILTIEGLLNGTQRARFPDLMRGGLTFRKAQAEQPKGDQAGLF